MKIFHDTVHGDIEIPNEYCKDIIDTTLFQRLKRIEQTSMRALYPCARHDRFIHSIGVFHLGRKFIEHIKYNTQKNGTSLWEEDIDESWIEVTKSYELACLLHDVGHAPFSHTFEHFFDLKKNKLTPLLIDDINDPTFESDISKAGDAKPHEKISAHLAYTQFYDEITKSKGNCLYVVRMILGVLFKEPQNKKEELVNCFIPLLHGIIDVDRLDYACRDQWASGFSSARINIDRILSSGILVQENLRQKQRLKFCFLKNSISQIQSLIDIKNYQKQWVFSHQKLKYDQYLLKEAVEKMAEQLAEPDINKTEILNAIFDVDVFTDQTKSVSGHGLYLLSDDDIIHIMKGGLSKNPFAQEWFSRNYTKRPLWKTVSEFIQLFSNSNKLDKNNLTDVLEKICPGKYLILEIELDKLDDILKNDVWLYINNQITDYKTLGYTKGVGHIDLTKAYYIYINKEVETSIEKKIIDEILAI